MIATLALLLAATGVAPEWVAIGVSGSDLRVFVDRRSIADVQGLRRATVRIGSPRAIAGRIVLVYQHEAFDCRARTWRLISYDARDADDRIMRQGKPSTDAMLPAATGSLGDAVLEAVCGAP